MVLFYLIKPSIDYFVPRLSSVSLRSTSLYSTSNPSSIPSSFYELVECQVIEMELMVVRFLFILITLLLFIVLVMLKVHPNCIKSAISMLNLQELL